MKKLAVLPLLCMLSLFSVQAQDANFTEIPKALYDQANTAKDVDYLTAEEKEVVYLVNLARLDGALFTKTYLHKYLKDHNLRNDEPIIKELIRDLTGQKAEVVQPTVKLSKSATFHAKDSGSEGYVGHDSSDGTSFGKRLRNFGVKGAIAENCSYGYQDSEGIMMQLLIDRNVPSRGHRKNILNPAYKYIGVAIQAHSKWSYTCVQDFSSSGS